jgi:hypothetical protein
VRQIPPAEWFADEAGQLARNEHVAVRDPHGEEAWTRRLMIGRTDGGEILTLVIEPTTWLIVTGWSSTEVERNLLERQL